MRTLRLSRAALVALTVLVTLATAVPAQPVDARKPLRKIEPRFMTSYRIGRVFTPNTDILSRSGYAAWMIDEALGATTTLPRLGSAFLQAERKEGLNARYFVAHAMLETGWGTSAIARLKHNLFGYGAYDRDPWRYAARFRTYKQGILAVAEKIRDRYLSPTGRWWYGFTTLRGVNRYYASDVHWADKIAVLANELDRLVVTLKERRLRFGRPAFTDTPIARTKVKIEVPWKARKGAVLPAAIRFRVRWTPIALVESSEKGPGRAPAPRWTFATRTNRPGHVVRLALRAPTLPGIWRVDIEARDSDGHALPKTDNPRVRSITVRVAASREATIGLAAGSDGMLAATVRNIGRAPIGAAQDGTATAIEAWALPLDPTRAAYRLAGAPLKASIGAGRSRVVRFAAPSVPSVVVVRMAGDPAAIGRSTPVAALVTRSAGGKPLVRGLAVASQRDDALLRRKPKPGRIALARAGEPGSVSAEVVGGARPRTWGRPWPPWKAPPDGHG